jgi:uncharacterized UPF0160 family protein
VDKENEKAGFFATGFILSLMENINTLVTHDGDIHPDEVMASVVLKKIYPSARLIRTRDRSVVGKPATGKIIFDVGMVYDPDQNLYDHHQPGSPQRKEGGRYSSFGLIWKHFGHAFLKANGIPEAWRGDIWGRIDASIVRAVDIGDNLEIPASTPGSVEEIMQSTGLHAVVTAVGQGAGSEEEGFKRAAFFCETFLTSRILQMTKFKRMEAAVERDILAQWGSALVILEEAAPFDRILHSLNADHVLFVIHPRGQEWMIRGVPTVPGQFEMRKLMPAAWAGREFEELDAATGLPGGVFCHLKRGIAVHKTKEGAIGMVKKALEENKETLA